jgi:hypothetical protein
VLKWIAAVTAILSLIFAIHQLVNLTADSRERHRRILELEQSAAIQKDETDYAAAWSGLNKAKEIADSGGQLSKLMGRQDRETRQVNALQEDLAMA